MQYLIIRDNRDKVPVHVCKIRKGETATALVERFQRNLAAMTPGGLNGVTWKIAESTDIVGALVEGTKL